MKYNISQFQSTGNQLLCEQVERFLYLLIIMFKILALPALSLHGEQHRESMRVVGIRRGGVGNCRIGSCCCLLLTLLHLHHHHHHRHHHPKHHHNHLEAVVGVCCELQQTPIHLQHLKRPDFYTTPQTPFNTCHNCKREVRRGLIRVDNLTWWG